jgi:hypothetical protein
VVSQPEPVATEAVVRLLKHGAGGNQVLTDLAHSLVPAATQGDALEDAPTFCPPPTDVMT